jgi:tetratricopeptide (TPR) repeat protein
MTQRRAEHGEPMKTWSAARAAVMCLLLAGCVQQTVREVDLASPQAVINALNQAYGLAAQHKYDAASALLRQVTAHTPPSWHGVWKTPEGTMIAYWDSEESAECSPEDSARSGAKVTWVLPSYSQAWYELAFIAIETQRLGEADEALEQALLLEPDHPTLINEKALLEQRRQHFEQALALTSQVVRSSRCVTKRALSRAWRAHGVSLIELGRLDEADKALRQSLVIDPENRDTLSELDYIRRLREKAHEAPLELIRTR